MKPTERDLSELLRRGGRRRQRRGDPNDRKVDHSAEEKLKRLKPEQWAELLEEDEIE